MILSLGLTCAKSDRNGLLPRFEANSSMDEISEPIRSIVKKKDFAIAFEYSGGFRSPEYSLKIFSYHNKLWEKTELRLGITEMDTAYSEADLDLVPKEIVLRKECRSVEGEQFMQKLISYKLFEIKDGKKLEVKCTESREDHTFPVYDDTGSVIFYIVENGRVRKLQYRYFQAEDCPNLQEELSNINNIQSLFQKEWFARKHY